MTPKEKLELLKRNTQEIITEKELLELLKEKKQPAVYLGTAITGKPHIGYFVWVLKMADFLKAGFKVKVLLADMHGALDNCPWDVLDKRFQYYSTAIPLMFKAVGVDVKDFARKSDKEKLKGLVRAFGKVFFPLYESGSKECGFSMLVKQTFWLAELELRIKGERVPGTWGGMGRKFGKDHIIQDALRFRVKKNKDKKVRRDYIKRLKRYLKSLEKLL